MRLLVVNPNTTHAMTEEIAAAARRVASPGTEVVPLTAPWGAAGIDTAYEGLLSAVAVMQAVLAHPGPFDAVVLAGFGEPGREGLMELLEVPVLDIAECSAHVAMLLGRSYGVVTTLPRSIAAVEDRLRAAGLWDRCAGVRATGLETLAVDADPAAAIEAVVAEARRSVEQDRAEVICLGCGGMAGLEAAVRDALGVPVVDGVGAAVRMAEALVGLGLGTSGVCTYATPAGRAVNWPAAGGAPGEGGR